MKILVFIFIIQKISVYKFSKLFFCTCIATITCSFKSRFAILSVLSGCAILLPMTYNFEPTSAIVLLATIYYSTMFGGSISAILLNIPGDSPAVMTALDGYTLARKGKAGKALADLGF